MVSLKGKFMETKARKKILYVITKSNFGGAQRYVFDLASAMKDEGHDVAVALGGEGVLKQRLESNGVRTISISKLGRDVSLAKDAGSFGQIYSIVKSERPDILHLNSPKAAGLGALAGRLLGVNNIIYTVHGWTFNEDRPLWQKTAIAFFSWLTLLFCDKVILLSEKELTQAKRFLFVKNKLTSIPLGIKSLIFLSREEARKKLSELTRSDISLQSVIGTIAELHPNKGLSYLVETMADITRKHSDTICVIIGDGQEKQSLQSLIKERRLENKVFLAGYVDEASRYLKAFDIFVLPSIKEGMPYVLLEAAAAGLPIIATNVVKEMASEIQTMYIVPPKSASGLAEKIVEISQNTCQKTNSTSYSFQKMLEETVRLY